MSGYNSKFAAYVYTDGNKVDTYHNILTLVTYKTITEKIVHMAG